MNIQPDKVAQFIRAMQAQTHQTAENLHAAEKSLIYKADQLKKKREYLLKQSAYLIDGINEFVKFERQFTNEMKALSEILNEHTHVANGSTENQHVEQTAGGSSSQSDDIRSVPLRRGLDSISFTRAIAAQDLSSAANEHATRAYRERHGT